MNIVIPIGGIGQRFRDEGYLLTKPLIRFLGKPMIFWILDEVNATEEDHIYLVYHHELKKYNFKQIVLDEYQKRNLNLHFIELFYQTEGAVETLLLTLKTLDYPNRKLISLDCDTFYRRDILNIYRKIEDNCVFCFEDNQDKPIYSYIKMNETTNRITEIKEKNKISNYANTGCYCFRNGDILLEYCEKLMKSHKELKINKEFYVSSVIKLMLEHGEPFIGYQIGLNDFVCLGTPHLVKIQSQRDNLKLDAGKLRFCFDLDYTLLRTMTCPADYEKVEPIIENINFLNFLKDQGHTIIIYTARRMRTHQGNQGRMMKDIGRITFDTLDKFGIRYDEIYFGKPYADYYIDDKSINSYYDLSKELGYYQLMVPERTSNNIKETPTTIIKSSNNSKLEGEIYYYQNIPEELKDLFPQLIKNEGNHLYEIEKIEGITLSHFYLNESLSATLFHKFLEQLDRLHQYQQNITHNQHINENNNQIDIYANYLDKIKKRYEIYDYSRFPNADSLYQRMIEYFTAYRDQNRGKWGMIHGDPVFTNILITKMMDFRFIDMRGKINDNESSIYGDIFYDYGKVYQSLLGYDEILLDTKVNQLYRKDLLIFYENYIKEKYNQEVLNDIKWITASLLFTLIPLHDNEKCASYYQLINHLNIV